ncbi:MAG: DNA photolyase family protein [Anaerolineae bacterium]|nr:DNA photolyase family protein [Anaerolineae bacterium]
MTSPVIHWFRRDLRLGDNRALQAASESGASVIPVFIFDPALLHGSNASPPRTQFLLNALVSLDVSLRKQGSRLLIRQGNPLVVLPELVAETGALGLYFNRDYTPYALKRDQAITTQLSIPVHTYDDALLLAPGEVLKSDGKPFVVFTPFKKCWLSLPKPAMVSAPRPDSFARISDFPALADTAIPSLVDLRFAPTINVPDASESEAARRLDDFIIGRGKAYATRRNDLASDMSDDTCPGTSFLSPYLRFGMLSPRRAYWAAREAYQATGDHTEHESLETWVSELVWREFYMHILYHFPHVLKRNFRENYGHVEWRRAPDELQAWKDGQTGYPIVDAAMRQLQAMGWMPNRARMVVASFLCKDLLIHWREGERHFMNWLIDGDPAANNGGWQWTAGTGTDAQPYFRIFNPVSQSKKFDPDGVYIRRWIPELRDVPTRFIHAPWEMSTPPADYPAPIVEHDFARQRTLAAFKY